ncbi:MAG: oxygenase MpaB family protein [Mycobacteriales bacterium]
MRLAAPPVARLADAAIGACLLAATANVIMQLALPGVGYGVVESRVDSGSLLKHPVKRTRTTLTYLAVVARGNESERASYRRGVNRSHAKVRSTASSPVPYSAFDPDLQLWVAACIYQGFRDIYRLFGKPVDPAAWERLYREAASIATILQVSAELWPSDIEAFERYWERELDRVSIDETVRGYLTDLIMLKPFALPVRLLLGRLNRFLTTGFLPQRFREEMRLGWDERQQRRFNLLMKLIRVVVRVSPPVLRAFPFNALMVELRWRIRTGRPVV